MYHDNLEINPFKASLCTAALDRALNADNSGIIAPGEADVASGIM